MHGFQSYNSAFICSIQEAPEQCVHALETWQSLVVFDHPVWGDYVLHLTNPYQQHLKWSFEVILYRMVSSSDQGVLPSNQMGKDIGIIADICSHIQQEVPHFLCSNASENFVTQISCTYMIYNRSRGGGSGILRLLGYYYIWFSACYRSATQ